MNKTIMKQAGFGEHVQLVEEEKCPFCKKVIKQEDFKDELSRTKFKISGLCQPCQDDVFG